MLKARTYLTCSASFLFIGAVGVAFALDPCNSEIVDQEGEGDFCGTATPCPNPPHPVWGCLALSVKQEFVYEACVVGGTASQRCEITDVVCTRSLYCKASDLGGCESDHSSPQLDPKGEPIVSWDDGAAMVSCKDQS